MAACASFRVEMTMVSTRLGLYLFAGFQHPHASIMVRLIIMDKPIDQCSQEVLLMMIERVGVCAIP